MGTEIERKFLVTGPGWRGAGRRAVVRQGFLSVEPGRTVRVRTVDRRGFLTVKGAAHGLSRAEFEYEIPLADADQMLAELCRPALIEKTRHWVAYAGQTWEVDEFLGANAGLVVAEIELESEAQPIVLPPWVGVEVSADKRYTNAYLSQHPFTTWPASS